MRTLYLRRIRLFRDLVTAAEQKIPSARKTTGVYALDAVAFILAWSRTMLPGAAATTQGWPQSE